MNLENEPPEATPKHGGDVYQLARALGVQVKDLLDFSANINPLGFPPGLRQAALGALEEICHYPDRRCLDLRRDLAAYHGLDPGQILVGNGSTELIYLLARALKPRKGLIVAPAFSEYEQALNAARVPVDFHLTAEADGFTLSNSLDPRGADLVFLANPASPSGVLLPAERLLSVIAALDGAGVRVVLDEAFVDFVEEASLKAHLGRFPRLILLRSFTKFFGIPGLRLGYVLAGPKLIERLAPVQEPWSVSTLAQAAGRACLADRNFMLQTRILVKGEREYLFQRLGALEGLTTFPSAVNYLLVKLTRPGWSAARLRSEMLRRRVIIRDASNFRGLDERFFRVAVRRRLENDRLVAALEQCFKGE